MRRVAVWSLVTMVGALVRPVASGAGCNMIPARDATAGFVGAFFGDTGTINTPFFAPGDKIGVAGRSGGAPAPIGQPADKLRTILALKPTDVSAKVRLLILERDGEGACDDGMVQACRDGVGAKVPVNCVKLSAADYDVVDDRLSIHLPAFDEAATPTLNGPVLVAVTNRAAQPPCAAAASQTCDQKDGDLKSKAIACIDALYEPPTDDTLKQSQLFSSLTLLPEENDFAAVCEVGDPGCSADVANKPRYVRYAVDGSGNVLVPMLWGNLDPCIGRGCVIPVHGEVARHEWNWLPPNESWKLNRNLTSFTRDGRRNDPTFVQETPGLTRSKAVGGTTDLRQSVLRFAQHYGVCAKNTTSRCSLDADCPPNDHCGEKCADKDGFGDCNGITCGSAKCGKTHAFAGTDGVLLRRADFNEKSFCQEDHTRACPEKQCAGECVAYALHADGPMALASPAPVATPNPLTKRLAGGRRECAVGVSSSQVAVIVGTGSDTASCEAPLELRVANVCAPDALCAERVTTGSLPPGTLIPNPRLALGEGLVRFFQGPVVTGVTPSAPGARYATLRVFATGTNALRTVSCARIDDPLHDPLAGDGGPGTRFVVPEGQCVDYGDVLSVPSICRPNLPPRGDCPPPAVCEPRDIAIAADLRDIVQGRTCAERRLVVARVRHSGKGLRARVVPTASDASPRRRR